ncbi:MAG: transcriptional repressor [Nitrospirae bacterium]|nr:transcriptional repressor [Nitrospirota bacterium]
MHKYRETGLKLTPQRLAILDYLEGNKSHPTAEDIYKAVSKRFSTMSLATVYNTLEALKRKGVVLELTIDPNKKRFDPDTISHHHIICIRCGKVSDVSDNKLMLNMPKVSMRDFKIMNWHIDFHGICMECEGKDS